MLKLHAKALDEYERKHFSGLLRNRRQTMAIRGNRCAILYCGLRGALV